MSLISWDPFRELEEMSQRLNRYLRPALPASTGKGNEMQLAEARWAPLVDIHEDKEGYHFDVELTVPKENVQLRVKDGILTVAGERSYKSEDKKAHRIERSYGSFMRSFSLPEDADQDKIVAEHKEGVLKILVPRATEKSKKTTEIQIR